MFGVSTILPKIARRDLYHIYLADYSTIYDLAFRELI